LCDECLQVDHSFVAKLVASLVNESKSANCRYCGGSPCGGAPDPLSHIRGEGPKNRWMCMSCSPEYYKFIQSALGEIPDDLTQQEHIERLIEMGIRADKYMTVFVRHRDN